jgi:hypothetical protein
MSKEQISGFEALAALFIVFVILLPLGIFMNAWMLTKLWAWFIVPQFGLAPLSYLGAAGLSIIVSRLTKQDLSSLVKKEEKLWGKIFSGAATIILEPLLTLGIAKIILMMF